MAPLNHCGIKRLLQEGEAAAKMLAARAGPRPEEEEEAFGARTARQVDSVLVRRALRRERALQARTGVDHAIEQQLEALRARDVAEMSGADRDRQRAGGL